MLRFFPAAVIQNPGDGPDDGFDVVFPDLPGCIGTGPSIEAAAVSAAEALSLHVEGMFAEGEAIPAPSAPGALPDWLRDEPVKVVTYIMFPVETPGRAVRVNVTLDELLLHRLDQAAAAEGQSRSGYLAEAVRDRLRSGRAPGPGLPVAAPIDA